MTRGSSTMLHDALMTLRDRSGEDFRSLFRSDRWLKLGLRAFATRLKNCERDALAAWLECVGAVHGAQNRAVLLLLGKYGLADETDLANKLDLAAVAAEADASMAYRLAKQVVRERVLSDPQERKRAMQEIFGVLDVTQAVAQHANGNGAPA